MLNPNPILHLNRSLRHSSANIVHIDIIKGTTRGLRGVFLPLVMNPLCPLKYYDRSITCSWVTGLPWPILAPIREESFRWLCNAAGPLVVPLSHKLQYTYIGPLLSLPDEININENTFPDFCRGRKRCKKFLD